MRTNVRASIALTLIGCLSLYIPFSAADPALSTTNQSSNLSASNVPASNVHDAVVQAIETNPDVQASWHAFKAATYQVSEARAGYLPSIDLAASGGGASRDFDGRDQYTTAQGQVSLTNMLFDGFRTPGQVNHFKGERLVRYYELLDTVETTAFEAVRAFEDVARERALVALARENYSKHQDVFSQIDKRVVSGVGRKVDLEQVAGRLALAETNLLTEASNLHDVTARYLRVVGNLPAADLLPTQLFEARLPQTIREALQMAYQGNPGFHAAIKNIAAAQANVTVERSGYYPKAELRARQNISRNSNGFDERFDPNRYGNESAVELGLTFNLYKGGANRAAIRRSLEEVNQAKDLRDKACADLRQSTQIAFNDSWRIKEQLASTNQHRLSSDKVRLAYAEQFSIGQRTLLDLLDAENEYFQASRAYVSVQSDLNIAHARTLASMGGLLPALKITRDTLTPIKDADVNDNMKVDPGSACPIEVAEGMGRKDLISDVVSLSADALFDVNSSILSATATQKLDELLKKIKATPNVVELKIEGHSDNTGTDKINIPLSKARADKVRDFLVLNGLENMNIHTEGYGSARPLGDNAVEAGRKANRRVEVTVTHHR
ncbi:MAG: TolC family outer membrane protein [Pseudomonadota bacterium]